ncbi:MAG: LysR family transcriptional regulator [Candidatus Eremiobacteraeota bacterium]|nr:LysR family transcriptional regulator [Candidatus Eremiobacteraeota bacterium]
MISLNQLKTFLEVASCGSVREAAEKLVISQPAVSAALAGLQREIGATLVVRNGRGLALTEAGEQLALYGRRIFALLAEGTSRARETAVFAHRRLRLAAVTTAAEYLAPDLLRRFREHEPEIEVELEVGNHSRVWDRLGHWEVDVVLAGRPPHGAPFRTVATRAHELVIIAPTKREYDAESLARTLWLVRETGSGTRAATEDLLSLLGIDPPRLTIGSNGAIQACVRAGLGVSLASLDAVDAELTAGSLQAVSTNLTPLARNWQLVTSRDRALPEAAARFIAFVAETSSFELYAIDAELE